jgi:hypothetical protein
LNELTRAYYDVVRRPIAWRANKQDTVTSSTEAELLALSQTAKEAIFISRLFKAMTLRLNEPLIIDCDNTQTLRIIREDKAKLTTKTDMWISTNTGCGRNTA